MGEDGEVQFVTGDEEIDDLEKRIANGSISDEEIVAVLASWETPDPEPVDFDDSYEVTK